MKLGDTKTKAIAHGMQRSTYALAIISRMFVAKSYPDHEYGTLLNREIETGEKVILPILYGGITHEEVRQYSEALANKYYLKAEDFNLDGLVVEILRVVQPREEAQQEEAIGNTFSDTATAVVTPVAARSGVPSDALPTQSHLIPFQPCLSVVYGGIQSDHPERKFTISWTVRNVGAGVARRVRIFMPGLTTYAATGPIGPQEKQQSGIIYEGTPAFSRLLRPSEDHLVAECEDHAGNIYRQYGNVIQTQVPSGAFYTYGVEELGTPYLVAGRIVQ